MHQGFDDEKGMVPASNEAPGHTTAEPTDSTGDGSPDCADVSMSNVRVILAVMLGYSNCQTQARVPPESA